MDRFYKGQCIRITLDFGDFDMANTDFDLFCYLNTLSEKKMNPENREVVKTLHKSDGLLEPSNNVWMADLDWDVTNDMKVGVYSIELLLKDSKYPSNCRAVMAVDKCFQLLASVSEHIDNTPPEY